MKNIHQVSPVLIVLIACFSSQSMSAAAINLKCKGCVGSSDIAKNAVSSSKIKDNPVSTSKIKKDAVNFDKLEPGVQVILDTADNNDTRITALEAVSRSNVTNNAPTSDDDINDGYSVGFLWVDTSQNQPYILLDNASGAAVWKPLAFNYFVGQAGLLALRY